MADAVGQALVAAGVLAVLLCSVGAIRARSGTDALHFASAASGVPVLLVGAGVCVPQGWGSASVLTLLTVGTLVLGGVAVTTALAGGFHRSDRPTQPEIGE